MPLYSFFLMRSSSAAEVVGTGIKDETQAVRNHTLVDRELVGCALSIGPALNTNGGGVTLVSSAIVLDVDPARPVLVEGGAEAVEGPTARRSETTHAPVEGDGARAWASAESIVHVMTLASVDVEVIPEGM